MRWTMGLWALIALAMLTAGVRAETASLFRGGTVADPLVPASVPAAQGPSLFADARRGSFFEPLTNSRPDAPWRPLAGGSPAAQIRDLIARAEAGPAGYDAVQYGARIKTPKPPTQMTIAEINRWIRDTPGQPHAIGRYQFIPPTFRRLIALLRIDETERFSPRIQDMMADRLLFEAGLQKYQAGEISRIALMNNLAKIWAGLPNSTGRSHYHGYAGNRATKSWAEFDRAMAMIFPK